MHYRFSRIAHRREKARSDRDDLVIDQIIEEEQRELKYFDELLAEQLKADAA